MFDMICIFIGNKVGCSQKLVSKVFNSARSSPLHQSDYQHLRKEYIFDEDCLELTKKFLDADTPVRHLASTFEEVGIHYSRSTYYKHVNSSLNMSLKKVNKYVLISEMYYV